MTEDESEQALERVGAKLPTRALWEQMVMERAQSKCSNCGSEHRVKVQMIVPEEAGGQLLLANGTTLCRACEIAAEVVIRNSPGGAERPVNFWVSRRLYDKIKALNGFKSTGSLIRFLMGKYVTNSDRFDDLASWQEAGAEVKINVWVDRVIYEKFKGLVTERGLTVTDALKAMVRMYEEETDVLLKMEKET